MDYEDNKAVASAVACSSLVKTAMAGCDANWGRIVCATGYSSAKYNPANLDMWMSVGDEYGLEDKSLKDYLKEDCIYLVKNGSPFEIDEEKASSIVSERNVRICIDLGEENNQLRKVKNRSTFWSSDLTHGYIEINADYRT